MMREKMLKRIVGVVAISAIILFMCGGLMSINAYAVSTDTGELLELVIENDAYREMVLLEMMALKLVAVFFACATFCLVLTIICLLVIIWQKDKLFEKFLHEKIKKGEKNDN